MIDELRVRAQTSGTDHLIHFNNAGASLMPDVVVEAIKSYIDSEAKIGGYETAELFDNELNSFYHNSARLINANHDEIAFTESATVAWHRAVHSISFKKGDVILTCVSEYASNYIAYLQLSKLFDVQIRVIPNDSNGVIDIDALNSFVDSKVKLISICHMPTGNGLINPVEEVGKVARLNNILYLLDACQSVGQYPIDVEKINCDFLSVTGRKYLRGPRGTGFLYARSSSTNHLEPMFLDLHGAEWISEDSFEMRSDARRYETWESNLSAKYGLSIAIDYLNNLDISSVYQSVTDLAKYLRDSLRNVKGIIVTDTGLKQSGIVTFTYQKSDPTAIKKYLSEHAVNVSIIVASSSLLDFDERNIKESIRASVHYFNTKEEIDKVVALLKNI
jgi:selenocysteine lyase/cysteine desulfurase